MTRVQVLKVIADTIRALGETTLAMLRLHVGRIVCPAELRRILNRLVGFGVITMRGGIVVWTEPMARLIYSTSY